MGNAAGAIPKPDGQKVTRHAPAFDWTLLPAAGRPGPPPKLPTGLRPWTKSTRDAWADVWSSPQATAWDQSGRTMHVWAALHHDLAEGERATASISAEMRQHEDRHGLNPAALLRLRGHYFAIGTVAIVEVCREVSNNWSDLTGGAVGLNLPILAGSPEAVGRFFFLAMLGLAFVAFAATILVDCSRFGFGLRCIRQNERAAAMVGIDVFRYKVAAFALSGLLAAAAGGIYASMVAFVEPKDAFSVLMTIEVPVMVMLGGMGTVFGPLVGGVFYVVLREFVWAYFIDWHSGILGVIVVVVIYFLPQGVFGTNWSRLLGRLQRRTAS